MPRYIFTGAVVQWGGIIRAALSLGFAAALLSGIIGIAHVGAAHSETNASASWVDPDRFTDRPPAAAEFEPGAPRFGIARQQYRALDHGDRLLLEDSRAVEIRAAEEEVYSIKARSQLHLAELCWHIGNRHLAAQIEPERIVILRDHVIRDMLQGLGAEVSETVEQFRPVRGAYAGHSHGHGNHAEPDRYGRMPGDPHYGHNHA